MVESLAYSDTTEQTELKRENTGSPRTASPSPLSVFIPIFFSEDTVDLVRANVAVRPNVCFCVILFRLKFVDNVEKLTLVVIEEDDIDLV